jgi:hypothetical protein
MIRTAPAINPEAISGVAPGRNFFIGFSCCPLALLFSRSPPTRGERRFRARWRQEHHDHPPRKAPFRKRTVRSFDRFHSRIHRLGFHRPFHSRCRYRNGNQANDSQNQFHMSMGILRITRISHGNPPSRPIAIRTPIKQDHAIESVETTSSTGWFRLVPKCGVSV